MRAYQGAHKVEMGPFASEFGDVAPGIADLDGLDAWVGSRFTMDQPSSYAAILALTQATRALIAEVKAHREGTA